MRADDILLLDMLLAAREAVGFLRDLSQEEFRHDRVRQLATIKLIEVIGEAAAKISGDYRANHPELPWGDMVGMRHRLVHDYFDINLDRVWRTVRENLPRLIAQLEPLVPPEQP